MNKCCGVAQVTAGNDGLNRWAVEQRLARIETMLAALVERQAVKDFYEVEEFAASVGKACFTVREWCRHGRIHAEKKLSGRGAHFRWAIAHAELLRYQREGLLPAGGSK